MFRELWMKIRSMFEQSSEAHTADVRTTATNEYNAILYRIKKATSLAELLEARKQIRNLQQFVIVKGEDVWGRPFMTNLNLYWKAKYEYWKKKTRGG